MGQQEDNARYYARNKERHKQRARERRERNRAFLQEYRRNHACVDCGFSDWRALDFDHVAGEKVGDVSRMGADGASIETLLEEIAKCEVRCANCHRVQTSQRAGPKARRLALN